MTPKKREWKPRFVELLRETGNVTGSARAAGISRGHAYAEREKSPQFARDWDDALEEAADALEEEARKRAKTTSDTLLIFLLKGLKPETYGDRIKHQGDPNAPLTVRVVYDD